LFDVKALLIRAGDHVVYGGLPKEVVTWLDNDRFFAKAICFNE